MIARYLDRSDARRRHFAGDDPERARYDDEDERHLFSFPERVTRYELLSVSQEAK